MALRAAETLPVLAATIAPVLAATIAPVLAATIPVVVPADCGDVSCVMGFRFGDVSWENTVGSYVVYLLVHKLQDGSVDATRAFVANANLLGGYLLTNSGLPFYQRWQRLLICRI